MSTALAVVLATATPAQARDIASVLTACADGQLHAGKVGAALGGDDKVRGFASYTHSTACGDEITYFEGSGASWTSASTGLHGEVVDVAADSTGVYLLHITHQAGGARELRVLRRSFGGTITLHQPLTRLDPGAGLDGRGSIVAHGGGYHAVWP
ncbi:hypothetical protein LZG04_12145 [Saccharothrix sp. S26]|uniref:hypothetical protein n=1 Tax=Saccharothrix sp. S26 TaxID=2907215 RepID=UPI001F2AE2B7|nr:hypothetical protein [Saccharothrix sp. S26]MCE6995546.1 hypothetical protein [Saccharothrix sp. S26]